MSDAPLLRAGTRDDAPVLALLHAACFEDPWSLAAMLEVLAMPAAFAHVLAFDGLPPAAMAITRVAADEAELLTLAVGVPWRRHGLARALLAEAGEEAARRGARRIYLEVAEDNAPARALYAAEGFEPIGRRRGYYARREGPAVDAITMRREIRRGWRTILRR
ncbi:MAG: GNAT family N-acetyltransferase [Alphaproteobacteria bacterium]